MKLFLQVLVVACFLLTAFKKDEFHEEIKFRVSPDDSLNVSVDELSFLSGNWKTQSADVQMEESWTSLLGHNMMSLHRSVKNNKVVSVQTLSIEQSPKGPLLRLTEMPLGKLRKSKQNLQTIYYLDTLSASRAVFATRDKKRQIIYERISRENLIRLHMTMSKANHSKKDSCMFSLTSQ